jgi:Ni/Fe-hydrogenase subunit HybB-like protein
MTATYTAFLFAQARARDLWQSPLRLPHLLVQSLLVGLAVLALVDGGQGEGLLLRSGAALVVIHLVLVLGEVTMAHPTSHAKAAVWTMTRGKFRLPFWIGTALTALGVLAPIGGVALLIVAAVGVLGYEHAYIQAGQSVPLA